MSKRRACRVIDADRKSARYRSTLDDDAGLRKKLRELANQRRRFGYLSTGQGEAERQSLTVATGVDLARKVAA